jgi:hypothetical protein
VTLATLVDWPALLELLWTATVAAIGFVVLASLTIAAAARTSAARGAGRTRVAHAHAAVAGVLLLVCVALLVAGLGVMLAKG